MKTSKQMQQRWCGKAGLAVLWGVAATGLSQTAQPTSADKLPQAGVPHVITGLTSGLNASTLPIAVPTSAALDLAPARLNSTSAALTRSAPLLYTARSAAPSSLELAQSATPASPGQAQVIAPAIQTPPATVPVPVPARPSAAVIGARPGTAAPIVVVPLAVTQPVPAPRPAATVLPSRPRPSARKPPTGISTPPQGAIAVQAGPSTPARAAAPDAPPPYPLAARVIVPEPTVTGTLPTRVELPIPLPAPLPARRSVIQKLVPAGPNVANNSLNSYVERLRRETSNAQPTPGAIWTESGRLTRLNTDVRAMRPNDLIQVVVLENLAASTDGTVKNQRASAAKSSVSSLIGALHASNALQNLINQSSANSLNATGASATNSSLTTTFGGQVIEVLPNGMLVIEAARQVEFSQQTQTIILRGLVRPEDISQENQVKSTAISSLELEVKGKGIVNDYTRRQNPLVRLLQQILIF